MHEQNKQQTNKHRGEQTNTEVNKQTFTVVYTSDVIVVFLASINLFSTFAELKICVFSKLIRETIVLSRPLI